MAIIDGAAGNAVITAGQSFAVTIINVYQWTATLDNEFFDRRIFGGASDSVQEYRGSYQITGTLSGYLDNGASTILVESWLAPGATVSTSLTLTQTTSRTWVFPAHLHAFSPAVHRYQGLNAYTCNFRSDGDVTFA